MILILQNFRKPIRQTILLIGIWWAQFQSKLYVSNNPWIYVYIKNLTKFQLQFQPQLPRVSTPTPGVSTPTPTPTPASLLNINSNSNSNSGSFNSNSNSGKSLEYQLQLQLRRFQLQFQLQLRSWSWSWTQLQLQLRSWPQPWSQHWFRQWLGSFQTTSRYLSQHWLVYRRINASLGLYELIALEHAADDRNPHGPLASSLIFAVDRVIAVF